MLLKKCIYFWFFLLLFWFPSHFFFFSFFFWHASTVVKLISIFQFVKMMLLCSSWLCIDRSRRGPPPFRRAHPVIYSARGDQDSRALPDVVTDFACLFWTDFPRLPQLRPKIMRLRSLTEMLVLIPFPVAYTKATDTVFFQIIPNLTAPPSHFRDVS